MTVRCGWATNDPLYLTYHDEEWGVPVHDDRHFFEMLILEGAQAGLTWITILRKREAYRARLRQLRSGRRRRLRRREARRAADQDTGIVRNRLKVAAAVKNARAFLEIQARVWQLRRLRLALRGRQAVQVNAWTSLSGVPASTPVSDALSKDLKQAGLTFVGSTIVYAFMQAAGLVNDHITDCFRYPQVAESTSSVA